MNLDSIDTTDAPVAAGTKVRTTRGDEVTLALNWWSFERSVIVLDAAGYMQRWHPANLWIVA